MLAKASEALLGPVVVLEPILLASADNLGLDGRYTYDLPPDGGGLRLTHSLPQRKTCGKLAAWPACRPDHAMYEVRGDTGPRWV